MKIRPRHSLLVPFLLAAGAAPIALAAPAAKSIAPPATPDKAVAPVVTRPEPVWSLAFSPDGKTLAAGGYKRVRLFDLQTRVPGKTIGGCAGPMRCLAWSPDGKLLAAGGGKPAQVGEVRVWNASGEDVGIWKDHKDVVEGVAFTSNGAAILSASEDEKVFAEDIATHKQVGEMKDHTSRVVSVAVSPDGKYVATGSLDKTVKIWSGTDFKPLANIDVGGGQVYAVAFAGGDRNGSVVVAAGEDGAVRSYRLTESRTGKLAGVSAQPLRNFGGNRTPVLALATAYKGSLLAFGGQDRQVSVMDLNSGGKYTFRECTDAVYALAISPDGSLIAAGSRDGKVRVWTTSDGKLLTEW